MKRHIVLLSEFDGSAFHGWQIQKNAPSVQETLARAWRELSGEEIIPTGSSRTDNGVSARGHISNFYTSSKIPAERVFLALNTILPPTLRVRASREIEGEFCSRRSAIGKHYSYRFWLSKVSSALFQRMTLQLPKEPNLELMQEACKIIEGEHDFSAFFDQGSVVRQTKRRITHLRVHREGSLITMECRGDGFLYHMVRIIAGTVLAAGQEKIALSEIKRVLEEGERKDLGPTLPPEGLCLERVFYPQLLFGGDDREAYHKEGLRSNILGLNR